MFWRYCRIFWKSKVCETPQLRYCKFFVWECFPWWGGIAKLTHVIHVVHTGGLDFKKKGLDKIIWFTYFKDVFKQCGLNLKVIYVSTRVLEFWVMEIINIYDFLYLLRLIKIRSNMDFGGGDVEFAHICHNIYIYIYIFFLKRVEKSLEVETKVRHKKHTMASIHFFFHLVCSN
jgi:hypothetical protein